MKKLLLLFALVFSVTACSVDQEELNLNNNTQELNAVYDVPGCQPEIFNFENAGQIEVINDNDGNLYISVVASEGHTLSNVRLHVADNYNDFPTVGQGNLPPGQMKHNRSLGSGEVSTTFTLPLSELGDCFYIASNATFSGGGNSVNAWAGNINGNQGNWSYFEYCVQECLPTNDCEGIAGPDQSIDLSTATIESFDGINRFRIHLYNDLFRDLEISGAGVYSPSLVEIYNQYQEDLVNPEITSYSYITTYTVENEDNCSDAAEITINILN